MTKGIQLDSNYKRGGTNWCFHVNMCLFLFVFYVMGKKNLKKVERQRGW